MPSKADGNGDRILKTFLAKNVLLHVDDSLVGGVTLRRRLYPSFYSHFRSTLNCFSNFFSAYYKETSMKTSVRN